MGRTGPAIEAERQHGGRAQRWPENIGVTVRRTDPFESVVESKELLSITT